VSAAFDTNIIIYAFTTGPKQTAARLVIAGGGVISIQVLNEFVNVMRRKRRSGWPDIEAGLAVLRAQFPDIAALTDETHAAALALARDHGFAFYDALIVASAIEAGCDTLYSEDMQNGRSIGGLTIRNPFLESIE
jgi:predicted nucleic acid-binding protein